MGKETAALLLILGVHVAVLPVLLWALLGGESRGSWRWWRRDDGDDPVPPVAPAPGGGRLPLGDAEPARIRLRTDHERLTDVPRYERRPAREPARPGRREPV